MNCNFQEFLKSLGNAELLLKDYSRRNLDIKLPGYLLPEKPGPNLLDEWTKLCDSVAQPKPPIRIIQHMSCTGGTIICKCLAGMPNVALLSEVNPFSQLHVSYKPKFAPTDLAYLALQGKFPLYEELSEKIFKANIRVIAKHTQELGKHLVIREHSHSDYLVGGAYRDVSTIKELLRDNYPLLSILTVRHPVDSYLSLISNQGWVHFTPATFDEYCKRYLIFIKHNKDVPLHKYEDFLANPKKEVEQMCTLLNLPFSEKFQDVFELNAMSGDSGRASNVISSRERRECSRSFRLEVKNSAHYLQLCDALSYDPSIATS